MPTGSNVPFGVTKGCNIWTSPGVSCRTPELPARVKTASRKICAVPQWSQLTMRAQRKLSPRSAPHFRQFRRSIRDQCKDRVAFARPKALARRPGRWHAGHRVWSEELCLRCPGRSTSLPHDPSLRFPPLQRQPRHHAPGGNALHPASLSLGNVEDLQHERGVEVGHETVRYCWNRFGPRFAGEIRGKRVEAMRAHRHWQRHLDGAGGTEAGSHSSHSTSGRHCQRNRFC